MTQMTPRKKLLITIGCLAAILCAVITGTIAWLIDNTDPITNTFTPSNIKVELTEVSNTDDGKWEGKLIPGTTLAKKATVTVENDIDCWVFVKVEESGNLDTFITWAMADGWTELETNVFYRAVSASDESQEFSVIKGDTVTVKDTVDKEDMATLINEDVYPKLTFTAYAAQQANLTVEQAWEAINGNS